MRAALCSLGGPLWVKSEELQPEQCLLGCPQQRTWLDAAGMSQKCHEQSLREYCAATANTHITFKLFETTRVYRSDMTLFFTLLSVAVIAYRVFVKGESIIVKNPNWKMRGLACLVMGLTLTALSAFFLIDTTYIHHVPRLRIMWVMLSAGVFIIVLGVWTMKRSSTSQLAD
jgi:hypothetical protein